MKKLAEHTYGPHIWMALELDNGERHEIDVYIREDGENYKTDADDNEELRREIAWAFTRLY